MSVFIQAAMTEQTEFSGDDTEGRSVLLCPESVINVVGLT